MTQTNQALVYFEQNEIQRKYLNKNFEFKTHCVFAQKKKNTNYKRKTH